LVDASGVGLAIVVTVVPFYLALLLPRSSFLRNRSQAFLGLALGMSFYFLFDGFVDSTELGVTSGYNGGPQVFLLVGSFAMSFSILVLAKRSSAPTWPLWVVAAGISIHSFSEAGELAASAALYLNDFQTAFASALSFVAHKFLEGVVLAAVAVYMGEKDTKRILLAGVPMVVAAVFGSLSSLVPLDESPFIAAGVGGWLMVTLAASSGLSGSSRTTTYLLVLAGFIIVYSATLVHFN